QPIFHADPVEHAIEHTLIQSSASHRAANQILLVRPDDHLEWMLRDDMMFFQRDRKSKRLNSSHVSIWYAVFCLKKKILLLASVLAVVGEPRAALLAVLARSVGAPFDGAFVG